jgi:CO/xanthine dehydrogenase FAD-binding subunit
MRRFTIEQPTTLTDAPALLRAREDARVIAGGTALVLLMKEGLLRPATLVALRRIPGLTKGGRRRCARSAGGSSTVSSHAFTNASARKPTRSRGGERQMLGLAPR